MDEFEYAILDKETLLVKADGKTFKEKINCEDFRNKLTKFAFEALNTNSEGLYIILPYNTDHCFITTNKDKFDAIYNVSNLIQYYYQYAHIFSKCMYNLLNKGNTKTIAEITKIISVIYKSLVCSTDKEIEDIENNDSLSDSEKQLRENSVNNLLFSADYAMSTIIEMMYGLVEDRYHDDTGGIDSKGDKFLEEVINYLDMPETHDFFDDWDFDESGIFDYPYPEELFDFIDKDYFNELVENEDKKNTKEETLPFETPLVPEKKQPPKVIKKGKEDFSKKENKNSSPVFSPKKKMYKGKIGNILDVKKYIDTGKIYKSEDGVYHLVLNFADPFSPLDEYLELEADENIGFQSGLIVKAENSFEYIGKL